LGTLGDASVVVFLAMTAASSSGPLQQAARESLVQLRAEGVDPQILKAVQAGDATTRKELISAIRERRIEGASDVLIRLAADTDADVSRQALVALGELGRSQDMPALLGMLLKAPSQGLEDALVAIGRRIEDTSQRSDAVLTVLDSAKDPGTHGAVLRVLGRLGSDKGLAILRKEMASPDTKIRTEAIRALAEWPSPAPMQDLWNVAKDAADLTQHVLALRGYINMVAMPSDVQAAQKVTMLVQAMAAAKRDEEKKLILSVLPRCACVEALDLAESALANAALKAEAETAIVGVSATVIRSQPDKVRPILDKVLASTENRSIRQRINQILRRRD
jgi:HEAT repeat protein